MSDPSVAAFNAKVAASVELQARLRAIASPVDLVNFAREQGIELTSADLQAIAQTAYQQWINHLNPAVRPFFEQAQVMPALNAQLKQCQTPADALGLAQRSGFDLTIADLQHAAAIAESIPGFSFEKLWFRNLGLLA